MVFFSGLFIVFFGLNVLGWFFYRLILVWLGVGDCGVDL